MKEFKLKTIIDLRTKTEHIQQAQKLDAKTKSSAAIPQSNDDVSEPLKIPGITYHEVNFNGNAFSWMLISKLSWMEFLWLILLMAFGYRTDAIKILAPKMNAMGLIGIAKSSLDVCKKEVKEVFNVLANEESYPLLVHCTQGKDRTGLIVMLVLFILGLDGIDVIEKDYLMSEQGLKSEQEEMLRELAKVGMSGEFTTCPQGMVREVARHVEQSYGNAATYLKEVGLADEQIDSVRSILLRTGAEVDE